MGAPKVNATATGARAGRLEQAKKDRTLKQFHRKEGERACPLAVFALGKSERTNDQTSCKLGRTEVSLARESVSMSELLLTLGND